MKTAIGWGLVLVFVLTGCGGDDTSAADAADTDPSSALDFLGDLPEPLADPITTTIGEDGATVALEEATLVASAGAFPESTEVTAQTWSLDLAPGEGAWARAYVISTTDDIALAEPVVLELPRPATGMRAVQIIDGETMAVEVGGTETAQIEIPHFSEVATLVVEAFNQERAAEQARAEQGAADAAFLRSCVFTLRSMLGADAGPSSDAEYASQLAVSLCTTALVRRASPSGVRVSTACVGDRIGGGVELRAAIEQCAADDEPTPEPSPASIATEDDSPPSVGDTEDTAAEDGAVQVDSAGYAISTVAGQLEETGYSVIEGFLDVTAAEGELTVTGTVIVEKTLFGPEVGPPICTSIQAVDVTATAPIEPEMQFRLQATGVKPFEVKAYADQCKPDTWVDNAERHQQLMLEHGPATVRVTVENGTLTGSVSNGVSANNLERVT